MNQLPPSKRIIGFYLIAVVGTFLIMAALVWAMQYYSKPAALNVARAEERRKALAEIRAANSEALDNYAWQNQAKGIVCVPIEQAMKLAVREWQNPATGRSNLIFRAEQASAAPPKAPEKPSQYE